MRRILQGACLMTLCVIVSACSEDGSDDGQKDAALPVDAGPDAALPDSSPDAARPVAKVCTDLNLTPRAFDSKGPYGVKRHSLVEDFALKMQDGSTFKLSEAWSGCESYIFIPDTLRESRDSTSVSVWTKDLATLVAYSPLNAHYFFLARSAAARSDSTLKDMQGRLDKVLASLAADKKAHWKERLHVVATHANDLTGWMKTVAGVGVGTAGFTIDRFQRLRGLGSLADVHRYSAALKAAGKWPWTSNLAYAAHEAMYYNFEAKRQARLDAEKGVTEVKLWTGQVISQYAEMDATLPDAATMATFDTLELDVTQRCPKDAYPEAGNCGAWDYISNFFVKDAAGKYQEMTRLITTYHREGRWLVDMSPMLAWLAKGGKQSFKWSWAPSWNKQPTATWLSLRFSNRKKGVRATKLVPLFEGGKFGVDYNKSYKAMSVEVPAGAKKVMLWAIISGHGQSASNCAEFCNHQHVFDVNGTAYKQQYLVANSKDGCMKAISKGVVPNQWGTWWLGRGGWCPGQEVPPFSADITSVAPAGKKASISYKGQFKDGSPPSDSKPGTINMKSYLVVYE